MNTKGRVTSMAERVEIGEQWAVGQNDRQIALALQRPVSTIRKWRRRNQHAGRPGLASQMGRPARGALSQFPGELSDEIYKMRKDHPGWGPLTILVELKKDARFAGLRLPSRSQVAAYLKDKDMVKKYEHHQKLPEPKRQTIERPHQEWEVDAQGKIAVDGLGSVSIINVLDVFSCLKIDSQPCLNTTHANTQDYQLVLRRAFVCYGLPEQISLDHDSVFYDNQTASPFPTNLHLWLIGLGIAVRFIHQSPPAEHARIERNHQTITKQAVLGQTFNQQVELQNGLTGRIFFLNHDYPSRSLNGQPPLTAYPQAAHSQPTFRTCIFQPEYMGKISIILKGNAISWMATYGQNCLFSMILSINAKNSLQGADCGSQRPYRLEWEPDFLNLPRIYTYLAQGRWFRQTSSTGTFSLGAQRYNARTKLARQTLEITFDPQTGEFICLPDKSTTSFRLPAQGLTKEALMGELDPLNTLPIYQLALPFSRQAWREMMICQDLPGTTF